jgi:hypothetical protein
MLMTIEHRADLRHRMVEINTDAPQAESHERTLLTESFEFLWCSIANRLAEALVPRGRQVNRGIQETLRGIKQAAETRA